MSVERVCRSTGKGRRAGTLERSSHVVAVVGLFWLDAGPGGAESLTSLLCGGPMTRFMKHVQTTARLHADVEGHHHHGIVWRGETHDCQPSAAAYKYQ